LLLLISIDFSLLKLVKKTKPFLSNPLRRSALEEGIFCLFTVDKTKVMDSLFSFNACSIHLLNKFRGSFGSFLKLILYLLKSSRIFFILLFRCLTFYYKLAPKLIKITGLNVKTKKRKIAYLRTIYGGF